MDWLYLVLNSEGRPMLQEEKPDEVVIDERAHPGKWRNRNSNKWYVVGVEMVPPHTVRPRECLAVYNLTAASPRHLNAYLPIHAEQFFFFHAPSPSRQ